MTACRWPGVPCPTEATATAVIAAVGKRDLCDDHVAVMERLGMAYTIEAGSGAGHVRGDDRASSLGDPLPAGPLARRIAARQPEAPPAPAWRPAWLANLTARDQTGALR